MICYMSSKRILCNALASLNTLVGLVGMAAGLALTALSGLSVNKEDIYPGITLAAASGCLVCSGYLWWHAWTQHRPSRASLVAAPFVHATAVGVGMIYCVIVYLINAASPNPAFPPTSYLVVPIIVVVLAAVELLGLILLGMRDDTPST